MAKRATECRSCGHQVVWFKSRAGKNVPVNAETVEPGDEELDLSHHVSHFSTCPHAHMWRNSGGRKDD